MCELGEYGGTGEGETSEEVDAGRRARIWPL